jgi:hypothetical protein
MATLRRPIFLNLLTLNISSRRRLKAINQLLLKLRD